MSEEQTSVEQVEQTPIEVAQPSTIEQRAIELGWRPKEEFEGPEEDFIDAKEFVRRQPLFEKISHQGRELKRLRQDLDAVKTHYTTVKETEFKRAVAALKAERKTAISDGDGERYEALTEEIDNLEAQAESMKELRETAKQEQMHPTLQAWVAQNQWYVSQPHMRVYAETVGQQLHAAGMAPEEVLREVTKRVKKEFPNKFTNPNKEIAPNVSEGGKPVKAGGGSSSVEAGLTEQERRIMNTLLSQKKSDGSPLITREKYLQEIKESREKK